MQGTVFVDDTGGPVARRRLGGEFPKPRCNAWGLRINHARRHVFQAPHSIPSVGCQSFPELIRQETVELGQAVGDPPLTLRNPCGGGGFLFLSSFSRLCFPGRAGFTRIRPPGGEISHLTRFGNFSLSPQE